MEREKKVLVSLNIPVPKEFHRAVRLHAAMMDMSIADLVRQAVAEKCGIAYEPSLNSTTAPAACDR